MTQVLGVQNGGLDVLAGERTDGVGGLPERERDAMPATWLVKLCLILGPLVAIWQLARQPVNIPAAAMTIIIKFLPYHLHRGIAS